VRWSTFYFPHESALQSQNCERIVARIEGILAKWLVLDRDQELREEISAKKVMQFMIPSDLKPFCEAYPQICFNITHLLKKFIEQARRWEKQEEGINKEVANHQEHIRDLRNKSAQLDQLNDRLQELSAFESGQAGALQGLSDRVGQAALEIEKFRKMAQEPASEDDRGMVQRCESELSGQAQVESERFEEVKVSADRSSSQIGDADGRFDAIEEELQSLDDRCLPESMEEGQQFDEEVGIEQWKQEMGSRLAQVKQRASQLSGGDRALGGLGELSREMAELRRRVEETRRRQAESKASLEELIREHRSRHAQLVGVKRE
jgi:chromosome segregation ATPase